eukprot:scaffold7011_cov112-Isochrysis_galbana.AAC.4
MAIATRHGSGGCLKRAAGRAAEGTRHRPVRLQHSFAPMAVTAQKRLSREPHARGPNRERASASAPWTGHRSSALRLSARGPRERRLNILSTGRRGARSTRCGPPSCSCPPAPWHDPAPPGIDGCPPHYPLAAAMLPPQPPPHAARERRALRLQPVGCRHIVCSRELARARDGRAAWRARSDGTGQSVRRRDFNAFRIRSACRHGRGVGHMIRAGRGMAGAEGVQVERDGDGRVGGDAEV